MKSPAFLVVLGLSLILSSCGSNGNTTVNTTNTTTSNTVTTNANTSNTTNSSNTTANSNTSTESTGSHPTDQIDPNAKIENGKTITRGGDITLTIPADWKKDSSLSNDNADWYSGKTKDGKELTLVILWMPAGDEYKGMSAPEAAMKDIRERRKYAEENPDRYTLPRILKLVDHMGVAMDRKSTTPDGFDEWEWTTWDSADFKKGITFRYPAKSFDQYKSLRDGIINSLKIKRGPRMPS